MTSNRLRLFVCALVALAAVVVAGCGSSSSSSTTAPATTTKASSASPSSASSASSSSASGVSGKWSGQYSGTFSGTFALTWKQVGSKLAGTIDLHPGGTDPITGTVNGGSIKFGTVGGPAITYTGSVSGSSMSGNYNTPNGGGSWSANKS